MGADPSRPLDMRGRLGAVAQVRGAQRRERCLADRLRGRGLPAHGLVEFERASGANQISKCLGRIFVDPSYPGIDFA